MLRPRAAQSARRAELVVLHAPVGKRALVTSSESKPLQANSWLPLERIAAGPRLHHESTSEVRTHGAWGRTIEAIRPRQAGLHFDRPCGRVT